MGVVTNKGVHREGSRVDRVAKALRNAVKGELGLGGLSRVESAGQLIITHLL